MRHETTINELAEYAGLFSVVDHITVHETDPNTGVTEPVTLPPPLIRRSQRRDTTVWILTPPGIHERIFVADQAPVTVYLKDTQHQAPAPQPTAWQQQPAPQPAAPQRPAAPWSNQRPQG
ncbi:hypothetical protein ACFWGI_36655 [Streptomyces niveus]|uniref:hypothetical protein n=1 Tax=Streptomyces niveus TaxID=193462 RepID=UPI0036461A04